MLMIMKSPFHDEADVVIFELITALTRVMVTMIRILNHLFPKMICDELVSYIFYINPI